MAFIGKHRLHHMSVPEVEAWLRKVYKENKTMSGFTKQREQMLKRRLSQASQARLRASENLKYANERLGEVQDDMYAKRRRLRRATDGNGSPLSDDAIREIQNSLQKDSEEYDHLSQEIMDIEKEFLNKNRAYVQANDALNVYEQRKNAFKINSEKYLQRMRVHITLYKQGLVQSRKPKVDTDLFKGGA